MYETVPAASERDVMEEQFQFLIDEKERKKCPFWCECSVCKSYKAVKRELYKMFRGTT